MLGSLGEKLVSAGLTSLDHSAKVFARNFISAGGTREQWLAAFEAAEQMPGRIRQPTVASGDLCRTVPPRQPVEDAKGHFRDVLPDLRLSAPASSSNRGGEGLSFFAPKGHRSPAVTFREPTASQREAMRSVAKVVAITIMDTLKIDGIAIGDWSVALARVEGRRKTRDGYILREAVKLVANAPGHAKLRDIMKISELQRIQQNAEEAADAV